VRLICSITDGIPAQDMMRVKRYLMRYPKDRRPMMVGPNCAGIISPGKAMLGIMPGHIYLQGKVGIISRSGTLGYEAASQMKAKSIGITTSVGIGGDPINGSSFLDHLALFEEDPETEAVLMIGEIGGPQEAEASAWIKDNMSKPVIGFVAGLTAPKGRRMGHAGAIISAVGDSASMIFMLTDCSVASITAVVRPVAALLRKPKRPSKWFRLKTMTVSSSGRLSRIGPPFEIFDSRFSCVRMTPLGSPVEPEVYMIEARS